MLSFDIKRKINTLRDILVGKVPDPKAQVEQITIALIYKFMDDMDLSGLEFGGERVFFAGDYQKYAFSQIMLSENSAQERLNLYAEGIDKMTNNPELPQLFRDILRNTYIPYRDPETLNRFLKEIADFSYDDSEDLGNAFEYLLSIMGSQGDAGQFRTPRHIIDMMVEIIEPQKNESILDPACGTAGFLISAYNYIKNHNVDEHGNSTLTADDRNRINANFAGYDISPDMVRLSRVNMYLHRFSNPNISEYDTLTSLDKWEDKYDVIFANPPFMTPKGGIVPHSRYQVSAKRAEVLFVDYIAEHLLENGRAAVIVPEGIVFQSQTAYKQLRDMLIKEYLYAVISLPAGVFNPYSGVKTSILIMDKLRAKEQDSILFVKLNNDGYDLGAQRREIKGSEIPDVLNIFRDYKAGKDVSDRPNVVVAKKEDIKKQDYILVGERYYEYKPVQRKWSFVELGEVCEFIRGLTYNKEDESSIPTRNAVLRANNIDLNTNSLVLSDVKYLSECNEYANEKKVLENDILICASSGSKAHLGKFALIPSGIDFYFGGFMGVLRHNDKVNPQYLYYCLTSVEYRNFIASLLSGANINNIRSKELLEFKIPLTPLTVQQEIVDEIESYQRIIDGARQVVDNYKPTIKVEEGWEQHTIGEICEFNPPKSQIRSLDPTTLVSFVPMSDINEREMLFEAHDVKEISEVYNGYTYFSDEDVILAKVTPCFENGKSGVAHNLTNGIGFGSSEFFVLRANKEVVLPEIIYMTICSADFLSKGKLNMSGTGGLQRLSKNFVLNYPIYFPKNIEEQQEIVNLVTEEMSIVEQNKRLIEIFRQKIADKIAEVWGE